MCGQFGMVGTPNRKTPKIIKHLGILNMSRGKDSTGIALISPEKTVIQKDIVPALRFFDKEITQALNNLRYNNFVIYMGHTRAATHGAVSIPNAHPFTARGYVYTHNGIISNFSDLQEKYHTKYEVDSQIIGKLLSKRKSKAFDELSGLFAIPFVSNQEPDCLRVAVHNQMFAYAIRRNQMFYSSDIDHLKEALKNKPGFEYSNILKWKMDNTDVLLTFYSVNGNIAVSKEKINPVKTVYSYTKSSTDSTYKKYQDYGYDKHESDDEYHRGNQLSLPEPLPWEELHKTKLTKDCTFLRSCPWKGYHSLMDAVEKDNGNKNLFVKESLADKIKNLAKFSKKEIKSIFTG